MTTLPSGVFDCIDGLWEDLITVLMNDNTPVNQSRLGPMRERLAYSGTLLAPELNFLHNTRRKIDPSYACAEVLWYLSRTRHIDMIKAYAPQYVKFAEDGIAHGAYGDRLATNSSSGDQIKMALDILRDAPHSRQCIITMWDADKDLYASLYHSNKDIPCTISWQLFERNGKLHMVCYMRSNDAWLGTPYDIFVNTTVQQLMAVELGLECGSYTHMVGSMHIYEKHWNAAREAVSQEHADKTRLAVGRVIKEFVKAPVRGFKNLDNALDLELIVRSGMKPIGVDALASDYLRDVALTCAAKWDPHYVSFISSTQLLNGLLNHADH